MIAKGARSFTYSFETRESIKAYLAPNEQVSAPATLDLAHAVVTVEFENPATIESLETTEPLAESAQIADQAEPLAVEIEAVGEDSLDMFPVFLKRLPSVLGTTSKTEEEIRVALGLEKSQVKPWIATAVSDGRVEKLNKPVAYTLPKQKPLC